jgi:hypothetical protein
MNKICFFLFLSLFFIACSNDSSSSMRADNQNQAGSEQPPIRNWPAMVTSKTEVHFNQDGGSDTISVKNYGHWWINSGCDGECAAEKYIYPNTSETGEEVYNSIDGGWWSAKVLKNTPNKIVITAKAVEECQFEECSKEIPRRASIGMTAGDVFAHIKIYQE